MKIGLLISSLTQNIPYMTYLVSNGYDVFPILLQKKLNCMNKSDSELKNIIEKITNKTILERDLLSEVEKLDCLIILGNGKGTYTFENINYNVFLKENAPIIISTQHPICMDNKTEMSIHSNVHLINYQSANIIDNCNAVISNLNKILQKK